jgi:hypothetical protein
LERREVVWIDGGHHSNEYSGVYFALAWAQFLVEEYGSDANATWIVENRHSWVMPMVNPDGSHAFGRLNAKGVNINRNYPVIWDGEGHDAVMNNRGPAPASEVETQINIEWFNLTRPDYAASIHCCGNLWLYPYGQEGIDPIDNPMFSQVCKEAFPTVPEACGPIWSTIYPASGRPWTRRTSSRGSWPSATRCPAAAPSASGASPSRSRRWRPRRSNPGRVSSTPSSMCTSTEPTPS